MAKIEKIVNGRIVEVSAKEAVKPKSKSDKDRLNDYLASRGDVDAQKKGSRRR